MAEEERKPVTPKRLTVEQMKKVSAWIESHAKRGCPVCGHPKWNLAQNVVEIRSYYGVPFLGGDVYPLVLLTCENCGYVLLFHAITIGALDNPEPERKKNGN